MRNPRALLIEDDRHLRDTISDLLELIDIKCLVADESMRTRTRLAALKPDLVLLDMPLRARDALRILTDIRRDFRLSCVKVVLIAHDEYANRLECRLADAVLMKPFAIGELEAMLRQLLDHHRPEGLETGGAKVTLQVSSAQG